MGDGRIFLKTRHDASFNKDLWNEPTFGRIHLAGQYLLSTCCRYEHNTHHFKPRRIFCVHVLQCVVSEVHRAAGAHPVHWQHRLLSCYVEKVTQFLVFSFALCRFNSVAVRECFYPGSRIRVFHSGSRIRGVKKVPDLGSRGQKDTGFRSRIRSTEIDK
jgi:hypothetical protein